MKNVYIDQVVIYIDDFPMSGYMRSDSEYIKSVDEISMFDVNTITNVNGHFVEIEYEDQIFSIWYEDLAAFEDFPEDLNALSVYFEVVYDEKKSKKR